MDKELRIKLHRLTKDELIDIIGDQHRKIEQLEKDATEERVHQALESQIALARGKRKVSHE